MTEFDLVIWVPWRLCNGCRRPVRPATFRELLAWFFGRRARGRLDVRHECSGCEAKAGAP